MPYRKKSIPKTLKNDVWDYYIGRKYGIGNCYCCGNDLDSKNFHCGHVHAESKGGKTNLRNLRPICSVCNLSMGNQNMHTFMKKYGYVRTDYWKNIMFIILLVVFVICYFSLFSKISFINYNYFGFDFTKIENTVTTLLSYIIN